MKLRTCDSAKKVLKYAPICILKNQLQYKLVQERHCLLSENMAAVEILK